MLEFYTSRRTEKQLADGTTPATADNIGSYTVKYAKFIASDGEMVVYSDEWTLYDSVADAGSGDGRRPIHKEMSAEVLRLIS